MVNHLNLNPVAVNQVKGFGAPRKGRSAEVLLVIGEKAETNADDSISYLRRLSLLDMHERSRGRGQYRAVVLGRSTKESLCCSATRIWPGIVPGRVWRMFRRFLEGDFW